MASKMRLHAHLERKIVLRRATLKLSYYIGRSSGIRESDGALSRWARIPFILAMHLVIEAILRIRGERFSSSLSHQLAYQLGQHQASDPGWSAHGEYDKSISRYRAADNIDVTMERSSENMTVAVHIDTRTIATASFDGSTLVKSVSGDVSDSLQADLQRLMVRYVNPCYLNKPQQYEAHARMERRFEARFLSPQ
jgi:hypothetical protein